MSEAKVIELEKQVAELQKQLEAVAAERDELKKSLQKERSPYNKPIY